MNQKTKLALLLGVTGAAALSAGTHTETAFADHDSLSPHVPEVLKSDTREFEASFLKVSATCKSSHAAFEEVAVALQEIPAELRAIHAEVERS